MTARYFAERSDAILSAAPFGYLGAMTLVVLAIVVARRLRSAGAAGAALGVVIGASLVALYLAFALVVWTALAYDGRVTSPLVTRQLFVLTILAVPILAAGTSLLCAATAWAGARARLPRWLIVANAAAAAASAAGLVAFGHRGFLSPDVQQQVGANIALWWPVLTGLTMSISHRRPGSGRHAEGDGADGDRIRAEVTLRRPDLFGP